MTRPATSIPPPSDVPPDAAAPLPLSYAAETRRSHVRWWICGLLFLATTINYMDRAVLGVLAPTLRADIGWSDQQYGYINAGFTLAYAIGFLFAGWFIDRVGVRIGYAAYLVVWSLAAAGHALAAEEMAVFLDREGLWPAASPVEALAGPRPADPVSPGAAGGRHRPDAAAGRAR